MTPLAWIVGLLLPACGASGAGGLPVPAPIDMVQLHRPGSPNTSLAAPAGAVPAPDIATPVYPVSAARLYQAVMDVALAQPHTFLAATYPAQWQAHFVARSTWLNFPDLVTAQVGELGPDSSTLTLYSRSVYGYSDLGVNRRRLNAWLDALQTTINRTGERH
jgi:uncharacterized protein (DUF1499 family)